MQNNYQQTNYPSNNIGGGSYNSKPSNYLALAIITTVLCCIPAGVVSIVYATKVDNLWNEGKYAEAQNASNNARTWAFVSLGLGVVGGIIGFMIGFIGALN